MILRKLKDSVMVNVSVLTRDKSDEQTDCEDMNRNLKYLTNSDLSQVEDKLPKMLWELLFANAVCQRESPPF